MRLSVSFAVKRSCIGRGIFTTFLGEATIQSIFDNALDNAFGELSLYDVGTQSNEVLVNALTSMDQLDSKYSEKQLATLDAVDLVSYSSSIMDLKAYCHGTTLWINFYRQRLMLSDFRVMDGIQVLLEERCPEILKMNEEDIADGDWLARLVFHVQQSVKLTMLLRANPKNFLVGGVGERDTFQEDLSDFRRRKNLHPSKHNQVILKYVRKILHLWLGGCSSFTSQARACLIRVLVEHLGTGCLLLPEVWSLYEIPPSYLFVSGCPRFSDADSKDTPFVFSYLDAFDADLLAMTLCNPQVIAQMARLESLYVEMYHATQTHGEALLAAKLKSPNMRRLLTAITADVRERRLARKAKAVAQATARKEKAAACTTAPLQAPSDMSRGVANSSSDEPHNTSDPSISPSVPTTGSVDDPIAKIIKFLKDAHYVATHTSHDRINKARRQILGDGDHYQPIRELGPSRSIMRNELSLSFAQTRAGFFSIQIFRCIHFAAEAFRSCPENLRQVEFNNIADYEAYIQALKLCFPGRKPNFFCNGVAHGTYVPQRKLERYRDYYNVSQRNDFTWPPDRNFATTWAFFKKYNPTLTYKVVEKGEEKDKIYRQWNGLGPLTRYMLVADMYGAGLLDPPTLEDIAGIAAYLKRGALSGLEQIDYVPEGASGELIRDAFIDLYLAVKNKLSDEQISDFQWTPITAEHMLCKFWRMTDKGHYC